jgi:hypothetical protein
LATVVAAEAQTVALYEDRGMFGRSLPLLDGPHQVTLRFEGTRLVLSSRWFRDGSKEPLEKLAPVFSGDSPQGLVHTLFALWGAVGFDQSTLLEEHLPEAFVKEVLERRAHEERRWLKNEVPHP